MKGGRRCGCPRKKGPYTSSSRWAGGEDRGKTRAPLVSGAGQSQSAERSVIPFPGNAETPRSLGMVCLGSGAWGSLAEVPSSRVISPCFPERQGSYQTGR